MSLRRLGEMVRDSFALDAFQRKVAPGRIAYGSAATGALLPVARWGELNRFAVPTGAAAQIGLPKIDPNNTGSLLFITKVDPAETRVLPLGKNVLGGAPSINGATEYRISAPGAHCFITDGKDWFSASEARAVFNVTWWGAGTHSSAALNVRAFQAAFDAASAAWRRTGVVQVVYAPAGLYRMLLSSTSWWTMPLNGSTTEFHGAVALRSGVCLVTDPAAKYVPVAPSGASASWYYGIFASAGIYTTVGALEQVSFVAPTFEFGAAYWDATLPSVFGIMGVGIHDLAIDDGRASNASANGAGRFARLMNCELWRVKNVRTTDVTQALYLAYMRQGWFSGEADGFVEAVDVDQACWQIRGEFICRNGTGEGQCMDISSVQDGYFRLVADSAMNCFALYPKLECWQTFADWVTNFPLGSAGWSTDPVMVERVTVDVEATDIHHATELRCFQISLDRTDAVWSGAWDGLGPMCTDVTLNFKGKDVDCALVYECKNLIADISLDDVTTGTTDRVNNAALTLRQARTGATALAESEISGKVRVRVKNSTRTGVRVCAPSNLELSCEVDGYNSADDAGTGVASGVWIEDLARKATVEAITIKNMRIKNGDTTVDPTDLRLTWDGGAQPTYVNDLGGHRLSSGGTQPMRVATFGYFPESTNAVVGYDTVAATPVDIQIGVVTSPGARLAAASIVTPAAIVGNAVDFTDLSVRRLRAGALSGAIGTAQNYDDVNRAAGESVELGIDGTDADGVLQAGDILVLRATQHGAGSIQAGLWVRFFLVEYAI